jgi:hypothetical protein
MAKHRSKSKKSPPSPWERVARSGVRRSREIRNEFAWFYSDLIDRLSLKQKREAENAKVSEHAEKERRHAFDLLRLAVEGLRRIRAGRPWIAMDGAEVTDPVAVAGAVMDKLNYLAFPGLTQVGLGEVAPIAKDQGAAVP